MPFATDVRTVKFLFLPADHDPDSYIRAHGKDAFAEFVAKALPLSKFMLQAASDDCDTDTAEGLARLTSQVGPMWVRLPEGAFKGQMLAAIAEAVQMDSRDLQQAWQPAQKKYASTLAKNIKNNSALRPDSFGYSAKTTTKSAQNDDFDAFSNYPSTTGYSVDDADYSASEPHFSPPIPAVARTVRRVAGRILPASREDRVLRLLLTDAQSWDLLRHEEHLLLCALPAPHGLLFAWLESQLHNHGPQPWAALREGLRGHAGENHAVMQLAQIPEGIEPDWAEVRNILDQLLKLKRQQEMQQLALTAATDPSAMQRYKELAGLQRYQ